MRDYASHLPVLLDVDLYNAGWNGTLSSYPGIDHRQFAMQALRKSFLKKFEDNPADTANANALELFLSINSKCRDWFLDTSSITEAQAIAMGEAKDFLYRDRKSVV